MNKKTILVVDSDPANSRSLFAALVKAGHSVTDTPRPEYALEIVGHRSFDVVILDVMCSRVGDADLIALARESWTDPLIIAMADFETLAVKKGVMKRGADHFINKPVDVAALLSLIEQPASTTFWGQVEGVDILEFLQFMLMTGKQTIVKIQSKGGTSCKLYIEGEGIVHAVSGALEGEEALYQCACSKGGTFTNLPWHDPVKKTISSSREFLLVEMARRRDEWARRKP